MPVITVKPDDPSLQHGVVTAHASEFTPVHHFTAPPSFFSKAGIKEAAGRYSNMLPALGAGAGGILAGGLGLPSGPVDALVAAGGAASGGVVGESARQLLRQFIFGSKDTDIPHTAGGTIVQIGKQGAIGGLTEFTGQGINAASSPVLRAFGRAAASRIPALPTEMGDSAIARFATRRLEHGLPTARLMQNFREKQGNAALDVLGEDLNRIRGNPSSHTSEEVGNAVQKALDAEKKQRKEEIRSAYKAISQLTEAQEKRVPASREVFSKLVDEQGNPIKYSQRFIKKVRTGGVDVDMTETKRAAIPILRALRTQKGVMDPQLLGEAERVLTGIVKSERYQPYRAVADSRSDLLAIARKLDESLPGKRAGIASRLADVMGKSILDSADKSGISGMREQIESANLMTRKLHESFERNLIAKIVDTQSPEVISGFVRKAGLSDIRELNSLISKSTQQQVAADIFRDMLVESRQGEKGFIDGRKLSASLADLGNERGRLLFGDEWPTINQSARLIGKIVHDNGSMTDTLHNLGLIDMLLLGSPHTKAIALGASASEYALAKMITNPRTSYQGLNLLRAIASRSPSAIWIASEGVKSALKEQNQGNQ